MRWLAVSTGTITHINVCVNGNILLLGTNKGKGSRPMPKKFKEVPPKQEELDAMVPPEEHTESYNSEKLKSRRVTVEQYSLTESLMKLDETIPQTEQGRCSCLGISALTFPYMINSMRTNMFTSHTNQFLTLTNPEHPFLFTGAEYVAGKYSNSYTKTDKKLEVFRKIVKFQELYDDGTIEGLPRVYKLFVYDPKEDYYDVITRKECTDLVENFGFNINNETIDQYVEGDVINKDTVLSKSSSYDENMLYGYGQNVTVMYTLDSFTSEDACVVSDKIAKKMTSVEIETIDIKLNDNDFLLNIYGDREHYKVLPNIGEKVSGNMLCAVRKLCNDQVLYDFKRKNLARVTSADKVYYADDDHEIVDITIYNNNEEIRENTFMSQVNGYLHAQNAYYKKILKTCKDIMNSASNYSQDIDYLYKRAKEMIDTKKRWKENDSAFSNVMIRIEIRKVCGLNKGQKLSGWIYNGSMQLVTVAKQTPLIAGTGCAHPYTAMCIPVMSYLPNHVSNEMVAKGNSLGMVTKDKNTDNPQRSTLL